MDERTALLNNALDALDRLFDRESRVVDVYAITYATARALRTDPLASVFSEAAHGLLAVVRAGAPAEVERERALEVTNDLRISLAGTLPWPEKEKQ